MIIRKKSSPSAETWVPFFQKMSRFVENILSLVPILPPRANKEEGADRFIGLLSPAAPCPTR